MVVEKHAWKKTDCETRGGRMRAQGNHYGDKKALEEVMVDAGAGKVFFTDIPVEEYIKKAPEQRPEEFQKLAITVGIGKDEPERYIQERWNELLEYARQEHISRERVRELLGAMEQS
ncbi:MAG: hypothetical protein NC543_09685 [bacterium]|nr:hypothetical protein [bacterium]